jgi:hypothetical protein
MDIHCDTSFRSILENYSISSTSRAHILSYLGKGGKAMVHNGCQSIFTWSKVEKGLMLMGKLI